MLCRVACCCVSALHSSTAALCCVSACILCCLLNLQPTPSTHTCLPQQFIQQERSKRQSLGPGRICPWRWTCQAQGRRAQQDHCAQRHPLCRQFQPRNDQTGRLGDALSTLRRIGAHRHEEELRLCAVQDHRSGDEGQGSHQRGQDGSGHYHG